MSDERIRIAEGLQYQRYPVRTCRTMHTCELCRKTITCGERYHDGGYDRRAHVTCTEECLVKKGATCPANS